MPIEVRRFGVGHRRPDGPPGTTGVTGQVIHSDGRGVISELAFARNGRIEPHANPNTTWFIVIEGGGWVGVDGERPGSPPARRSCGRPTSPTPPGPSTARCGRSSSSSPGRTIGVVAWIEGAIGPGDRTGRGARRAWRGLACAATARSRCPTRRPASRTDAAVGRAASSSSASRLGSARRGPRRAGRGSGPSRPRRGARRSGSRRSGAASRRSSARRSRSARRAGTRPPAASGCGRPRPRSATRTRRARSAIATIGVIRKSLTGMKTSPSVADDPDAGRVRVQADLLARLAQGGRGRRRRRRPRPCRRAG